MNQGFVKFHRDPVVIEMIVDCPMAFVLLAVIAQRARYQSTPGLNGLHFGQALLGDYPSYGMTRAQYRTAISKLATWGFATFRPTNKGTVATLSDSSIFQINNDHNDQRTTTKQPTSNQRATNEQPSNNHRTTTKQPSDDHQTTNEQPPDDQRRTTNKEKKEREEGEEREERKEGTEGEEGKERKEGEEGKKQSVGAVPPDGGGAADLAQDIADQWNQMAERVPHLTTVRSLGEPRRRTLRTRLQEKFWRENWRTALELIPQSDFLSGKKTDPKRTWRPGFDWFIRPGTVTGIIEGKYHDKQTEFAPTTKDYEDYYATGKRI